MPNESSLEVRLLGDLEIRRGGERLALPPSRKTRALLAYLLLTRRPHRRKRLCALLWDVADDPRGALRWSLSKLRALVDAPSRCRLVTDRESVALDGAGLAVDAFEVERALSSGLDGASTDALEALVQLHRGELLEGLDLGDFEEYQAWCIAEREQARARHARVLETLLGRLASDPARALPYGRALARIEPLAVSAHARVLADLAALGRVGEAELHHRAARRQLASFAPDRVTALDVAYGELRARRLATPASYPEREAPRETAPSSASPSVAPSEAREPAAGRGDGGLVGRRRELDVAYAALDACLGRSELRVLLLVGEPGIGKSRLLDRVLDEAARRGAAVARGRSWEVEAFRPYAPWAELLPALGAFRRGEALDDATVAFFEGTSEAARASEASVARERAFGALLSRLRAAADAGPVALGLDDVQWCDEASAVLLHLVARQLRGAPVLLVLAAREGELVDNAALLRALRGLRREVRVTRLSLGPLHASETAELLARLGSPHDAGVVHASSGGNPLYAIELARAQGSAEVPPESLAELVRDRVERLSPEAREVLAFGAVLGRRFDVELMASLASLDEAELGAALAELERHALLTSVAAEEPTYTFAHDAVRSVVHADVSDPRRRLMHRRVAELLSPRAADGEEQAALVAHHAQLGGAPELAARACVDAGRRALAAFAGVTAETFVRRGLRCASGLPERTRVPIVLELHQILLAARPPRDREQVARDLSELAERALALGDVEHARLGYQLLGYLRWEGGEVPDAARHLLEAEWVTRGAVGHERMRALAEAGRCLALLERNLPEADGYLLEAGALAKQLLAEPASLVDARALLACHRGDAAEALAGFERAKLLARREGEPAVELQVLEHEVMCAIDADLLDHAARRATELRGLAERARGGSELPAATAFEVLVRHLRAPEPALDGCLDELRRADSKRRLAFVLSRAALADLARGALDAAQRGAREAYEAATVLDRPSERAIAAATAIEAARARGDAKNADALCAVLRPLLDANLSAFATNRAIGALAGTRDRRAAASPRRGG